MATTAKKEYLLKFKLGDYSNDGHGQFDTYLIASDKPGKDVIEANNVLIQKHKVLVSEYCREYEQHCLDEYEVELATPLLKNIDEYIDLRGESYEKYAFRDTQTECIMKMWVELLHYVDPDLNLRILDEDEGVENMTHTMGHPGYGCFAC